MALGDSYPVGSDSTNDFVIFEFQANSKCLDIYTSIFENEETERNGEVRMFVKRFYLVDCYALNSLQK